ncbi:dTDP-4-dehydrorhamnose reductase [bacterium F11]|nr:dTDP-4-dehydrorhamnose reductase [bacterium F11]
MKKIVLFGVKGLLGGELKRQSPSDIQLRGYDRQVDITQPLEISKILQNDKPDWVINAAAYNQVDQAQNESALAYQVNSEGPATIAKECSRWKIPFIHFSTDYVFSGLQERAYREDDAPSPLSEYARSKFKGEEAVRSHPLHYILRVTTLYGEGRSNPASRVIAALKDSKPIKLVVDLFGSPTYVGDLAKWIFALIEKKPKYGTYHLAHTGYCSRYEFSKALGKKLVGKELSLLEPVGLKDLGLAAPRPAKPLLDTSKWEREVCPLLPWQEGLNNFLSTIKDKLI